MHSALTYETVRNFLIALLIGALIGIEREKHKKDKVEIGGLRTFVFFSALGAISAWLSLRLSSLIILAAAFVSLTIIVTAGYIQAVKARPGAIGLTTEVSALLTFLLGAMAIIGQVELAVALAISISSILAFKEPLHGLVDSINRDDLYAGLKLLIATFIILPLVPDKTIDPWNAINPYKMWLLVILISGLSLAGYVANRFLGPKRGILLTALTGALASSTAVTLSFAKQSREGRLAGKGIEYLGGLLLAWLVMFARVLFEVAIVNRDILELLILPFGGMALATFGLYIWFTSTRDKLRLSESNGAQEIPLTNPFSLTSAIKFALVFSAILLLVGFMRVNYPEGGSYIVATLAGLTDVDAITLSMAESAKNESYRDTAILCIVVAALANTALKTGLVLGLGGSGLKRPVLTSAVIILLVGIGISFLVI